DIRFFATTAISFVVLLTNAALTAIAFSGVLWTISPLLFAASFGYATGGALLALRLARPAVAQPSALLVREARLRTRLLRRLKALVANTKRVIGVNRNVGFFTTLYSYMI